MSTERKANDWAQRVSCVSSDPSEWEILRLPLPLLATQRPLQAPLQILASLNPKPVSGIQSVALGRSAATLVLPKATFRTSTLFLAPCFPIVWTTFQSLHTLFRLYGPLFRLFSYFLDYKGYFSDFTHTFQTIWTTFQTLHTLFRLYGQLFRLYGLLFRLFPHFSDYTGYFPDFKGGFP